jgi:hypothetical protein
MPNETIVRVAAMKYAKLSEACAYLAFQLQHAKEEELRDAFELFFDLRQLLERRR